MEYAMRPLIGVFEFKVVIIGLGIVVPRSS